MGLIRQKRMQVFDTLWLPGMDHAGIATQAKVRGALAWRRHQPLCLGRERFLEKESGEWKRREYATIQEQWGKMGLSVDYS